MSETIKFSEDFPVNCHARIYLVGIGGIGMSSLAQFLNWLGFEVAGSDRGLEEPARAKLFDQLRAQGIHLYPQNGSGPKEFRPEAIVVSTAIESDNADLAAVPDVPIFHRAWLLNRLCTQRATRMIGVAGTCGKTTVTAWIASALRYLGESVVMVNGGYALNFEQENYPGNFYADLAPSFYVVEIDESDHSINSFSPSYSIVLNVGHDHYGVDELRNVFRGFLNRTKYAAFYPDTEPTLAPTGGKGVAFPTEPPGFRTTREGIEFEIAAGAKVQSVLNGRYNAVNGQAVFQLLRLLYPEKHLASLAEAMECFRGVRQRFEVMSERGARCGVVNDFAHNPEKISAAISAARERFGSPLAMIWQPHGFKALGDQREALKAALQSVLQADDLFLMLPVYYAGGTTTGEPSSKEVAEEYAAAVLPVRSVETREEAEELLRAKQEANAWLVLGARDASLRDWTKKLALSSLK